MIKGYHNSCNSNITNKIIIIIIKSGKRGKHTFRYEEKILLLQQQLQSSSRKKSHFIFTESIQHKFLFQ